MKAICTQTVFALFLIVGIFVMTLGAASPSASSLTRKAPFHEKLLGVYRPGGLFLHDQFLKPAGDSCWLEGFLFSPWFLRRDCWTATSSSTPGAATGRLAVAHSIW